MKVLFFLTDRFPFGKGEAFIENEIEYLEKAFDRIYVLPLGLTVNTKEKRKLPDSFVVLPPANTDDLYEKGRPGQLKRMLWSVRYMMGWSVKAVLSKDFREEVRRLWRNKALSLSRIKAVVRALAPVMRNEVHFKKHMRVCDIKDADEVYVYSYWINLYAVKVTKCINSRSKAQIKRIVARAHRHDLYDYGRKSGYIPFKDKVIDGIDRLYLISKDGFDYIKGTNPQNENKYRLSYLGTRDWLETEMDEKETALKIVSCSYVIPVKRVKMIIDALVKVDKVKVDWTHIGGGQDLERHKEYAKEVLGGKKNIEYSFTGHIENKRLMEYYRNNRVDLFINVSEQEGLPVTIMEALSFGIPVVATDVGSTKETIDEGRNGYLLNKDFQTGELAMLIEKFASMTAKEHNSFRKASREKWEACFDARRNYSLFIQDILE